jgi:imidazolonepropionase-like amidohydrolase
MQTFSLILSTILAVGANAETQDATTAIVGARLEIGDGRVVENGTLVMRGDRIVSVGTEPAPQGAAVIDGKGLTVYPGFIDSYSTSDLKLPEPLASGKDLPDTLNTAPATMWHENRKNIRADLRAATLIDPAASFTDRTAQGITTVLFSGGSGSIAGTAALIDLTTKPTPVVAEAAEEFVFRGGGRFGGMRAEEEDMAGAQRPQTPASTTPTYAYPGTLFGIFALTRQTLWDARAYAAQEKPKADPTYEGLKPLVTGKMPAMFTLNTAREIARAGHLADEFGFGMVVNGAPDAYRMIDTLKAHRAPVILSLEVPDAPRRTPSSPDDAVPTRVLEDRYTQFQERMQNPRLLDAAGVTILFRKGSDDYLTGVRKLVKASGLPRTAALKAMTINPARTFGASERLGTLEAGKTANLVIMTGDFLDEKAKVQTTVVEGAIVGAKAPKTETAQ